MENQKILKLNRLIAGAYECVSFTEFLKLAIMNLNKLVPYDSGMFFCGISRDCSFFKPFAGGNVEGHYQKQRFSEREAWFRQKEDEGAGGEALVYRALDYSQGVVHVQSEPRSGFLASQEDFHIACVRIVYKGQFMGEIYLHRMKEKPDFDDEDMFILRLLQPHISIVFHIIHTVTAIAALETDSGRLEKKGLCLMDEALCLTGGNAAGYEMLKITTVFGSSVLFHVKELCEAVLVGAKTGTRTLHQAQRLKTDGGDVLINILFYRNVNQNKGGRFFLSMEYEDGEQAAADYKFKFTKREADIIDGIVQGKSNPQIAAALNLSENTVKTHLQNIFQKTGVRTRAELVYLLMLSRKNT